MVVVVVKDDDGNVSFNSGREEIEKDLDSNFLLATFGNFT